MEVSRWQFYPELVRSSKYRQLFISQPGWGACISWLVMVTNDHFVLSCSPQLTMVQYISGIGKRVTTFKNTRRLPSRDPWTVRLGYLPPRLTTAAAD